MIIITAKSVDAGKLRSKGQMCITRQISIQNHPFLSPKIGLRWPLNQDLTHRTTKFAN